MTAAGQSLYTPEAVRVDLPLADVGSRALAILIDLMVMMTALYLVLLVGVAAAGLAFAGFEDGPTWLVVVVVLLLNFLVLWGYPTGSETLFGGRTAGKAAMGLRVVTLDGAPVRFRHAAIRGLFAFVDFYLLLGIPALVTALLTRRAQRLGDLAAGTVTIRDRTQDPAGAQPVRWQVPPALQSYARTLDVRGLDAADYALVRRFLLRSGSLRPEHRTRIAIQLANAMAEQMHHLPPPGTHPEALLLCIGALLQGAAPYAPSWSPQPPHQWPPRPPSPPPYQPEVASPWPTPYQPSASPPSGTADASGDRTDERPHFAPPT